ncbi:hypothetical protein [Bradyrhizobium sp. BR 10289]|uniref:hypothetical protein n=1 Tax=Bradyrhizobium sp. BR 10289 TaxID=2749993 RepID=UPI001C645434|nr:hypothetical protein [Bradyrhizobium sp. BR 10289]MBW7972682.1 hypothetical protein [Bradyrhizobium sp. BR 10289]
MLFSRRIIIIALLLSAGSPTWAQIQQKAQDKAKDKATLVREAFASPYGEALTAELGKSLRASADPACVTDKGLAVDQLEPRGRDILITWGTRMLEGTSALIDRQTSEHPFAGAAELESLKSNADVKRYLAMEEPMRQAKILDLIFEHFDRHNLISRVKLRPVSPLGTGNEALLRLNPADATEEKLDAFAGKSRSKALKRFLQLSEQADAAQALAIKQIAPPPPLPDTFFNGVETDLAELCIRSGK